MTTIAALRRTFALLDARERREALLLTVCLGFAALAELASVAAIYPFLGVLADPAFVARDARMAWLHGALGAPEARTFMIELGAGFLALTLLANVIVALTLWWQVRFVWRANHSISQRLLSRHLERPYLDFTSRNSSVYAKQVLEETQTLVVNTIDPAFTMVGRVAAALLIGALLVVIAPVVTLAFFVVVGGGFGLVFLKIRRRLKESGQESLTANKSRFQSVAEAFGGIKQVKVSGLEPSFHARYLPHSLAYSRHQTTHNVARRIPYYAMQTVAFGGVTVLLITLLALGYDLGYILPIVGVLAVGGFRLLPAFQQILAAMIGLRFMDPLISAMHDDLTGPGVAAPAAAAGPPLEPGEGIRLEDITFTYPGSPRPTIERVNVAIRARTSVAFVGSTGAGKSTLLDIILGVVPPDSGRLVVDGKPIGPGDLPRWQRAIGYVPQEIFQTDDSIAANIAFGLPHDRIDHAAVERAARIAQLHEFIASSLPQGYATIVGERGVRLSGGQRQRIGIARALYQDPAVLVLDEATSDIDNKTEADISRAIDALAGKKTIIVVAHRLATVRACDAIHVIEGGRIVATGTYDSLLKDEPRFRELALPSNPS